MFQLQNARFTDQKGYLEYRFPNIINKILEVEEISFSMELCSEASGFLENWPSDITVSVNGMEVATYLSPGDFGARRGKLTPAIWENGSSQYGLLKIFSVKKDGGYIDGLLVNRAISLEDLKLNQCQSISLRIEVEDDALHVGGLNLFGARFGDYPQGIIMNVTYL